VSSSSSAAVIADEQPSSAEVDVEALEIGLLTEAIYLAYGYDFRRYCYPSLRRRLARRIEAEGLASVSALQDRVLRDRACMSRLLTDLSVNVSSMFRDPAFHRAFREKVVPLLRTYPFVRIWNAGCANGEETWSIAILLHEAGLYERTRIYATDMNGAALDQARSGIFPSGRMRQFGANYSAAGGTGALSDYYVLAGSRAIFPRSLAENIVFAEHNLVTDRSFNEFHVIVCRNVMIYFDRGLQHRVHDLLHNSLGSKESLDSSPHRDHYTPLDDDVRLYRKTGART